jgi:predicted nucleic acid-binding protein
MLKKLVDTNIFIDRFADPDLYKDIFLSDGLIYLSSVVLMEMRSGAHSKEAVDAVHDIRNHFTRVGRLIVPSFKDYETAGEVIAKLQSAKGYDIKKSASITNDCLLATSARNAGAVFYTQNKRDFQAIQDVFDFKVVFV